MKTKKFHLAQLAFLFLLASCTTLQNLLPPTPGLPLSTATPTIEPPSPTVTPILTPAPLLSTPTATSVPPTATRLPTETLTSTPTISPTPITFPTVVFSTNANCRLGPSTNHNQITNFLKDRSTIAEGRNLDSSWLWVKSPAGNCWIKVATLKDPIEFAFLPVIAFTPLPEAPSRLTVAQLQCTGRTAITLRWSDVIGETGYTIYRNGIQIMKLRADLTEYVDFPPLAAEYLYEIESFNDVGVSVRYTQTVQGCKK